jgi:hypothetical protein
VKELIHQRGFPMIYMSYDRHITYFAAAHKIFPSSHQNAGVFNLKTAVGKFVADARREG